MPGSIYYTLYICYYIPKNLYSIFSTARAFLSRPFSGFKPPERILSPGGLKKLSNYSIPLFPQDWVSTPLSRPVHAYALSMPISVPSGTRRLPSGISCPFRELRSPHRATLPPNLLLLAPPTNNYTYLNQMAPPRRQKHRSFSGCFLFPP